MKSFSEKGRRALRTIFRGLGVTAVSFIFQACYGPPPRMGDEVSIKGLVKSKTTKQPIKGIEVTIDVKDPPIKETTNTFGEFYIDLPRQNNYTFTFEDPDGPENGGAFKPQSVTADTYPDEYYVNVQVELEDDDD